MCGLLKGVRLLHKLDKEETGLDMEEKGSRGLDTDKR